MFLKPFVSQLRIKNFNNVAARFMLKELAVMQKIHLTLLPGGKPVDS